MNRRTANGERGAILAQVAISMLMLMGFAPSCWITVSSSSAADRHRIPRMRVPWPAQSPARSTTSRIHRPPGGVVELARNRRRPGNLVWNCRRVRRRLVRDCPPGVTGGGCVRVDVYRNGELASPTLPVLFAPCVRHHVARREGDGDRSGHVREWSRLPEAVGRRRQMARTRRAAMDTAIDFRPRDPATTTCTYRPTRRIRRASSARMRAAIPSTRDIR